MDGRTAFRARVLISVSLSFRCAEGLIVVEEEVQGTSTFGKNKEDAKTRLRKD